jgi:ABC-type multidrug transport system permease subunit
MNEDRSAGFLASELIGLWEHFRTSLRLYFRNKLALLYGYLFPLIFLAAFRVLYRHDPVPLLAHFGELLTVSVLGGACFGLPTTLVSERERGVWRRYRLTPLPSAAIVASTAAGRYVLVLTAGLLQLAVALAVGMPLPAHPVALLVAFTLVAWAFIGLGLVLAMLADNVPAVQALGQCVFLPMLIIGGVAVPLASLPGWAQHLAAFFPGRYAVEALQRGVNGPGFAGSGFDLLALGVIGAAAAAAAAKLFRWDAQQKFAAIAGKRWLALVFAAWIAVGIGAEWRGHIAPADFAASARSGPPWKQVTPAMIATLDFNHLPPDDSVVSPIAAADDQPDGAVADEMATLATRLPTWAPANEPDDVQAVRNVLCVCAAADVGQTPAERYVPRVVLAYLEQHFPREDLVKILTWIALRPREGTVVPDVSELGVRGAAGDPEQLQERVYLYAIKFVARLTGRVPP